MGTEAKRLDDGQRCKAGWDRYGPLWGVEKGMSLVPQRARGNFVEDWEVAPRKVRSHEEQLVYVTVTGQIAVFSGRESSLMEIGIKSCWRPKQGVLKRMKIIPCGSPALLPHLQPRERGRASAGEGFPSLRDGTSANLAWPTVLSGIAATEEDSQGPQGEGLFLRSP